MSEIDTTRLCYNFFFNRFSNLNKKNCTNLTENALKSVNILRKNSTKRQIETVYGWRLKRCFVFEKLTNCKSLKRLQTPVPLSTNNIGPVGFERKSTNVRPKNRCSTRVFQTKEAIRQNASTVND